MTESAITTCSTGNDLAAEIRETNQQFMNAFQQRDAAQVGSLYSAEALLLPPDTNMLQGTEAIIRFWKGAMDMGITEVVLKTSSVEGLGAGAVEVGEYNLIVGAGIVNTGKYLVVWRREDGRWKLHRDIWNANRSPSQ